MPDPLYLTTVESLGSSIDLAIRGCDKIHALDRKTRTDLLLGEIDEAQYVEREAATRKLADAWLMMVGCLLMVVEALGVFEGDKRIDTLRNHQRQFIAEH